MKLTWLVQGDIIKGKADALPDIIRSQGHDVEMFWAGPTGLFEQPKATSGAPVVIYGSFAFVRHMNKGFIPGSYGVTSNADCTSYMTHLPTDWLLNSPAMYTTWGDFKRNRDLWYNLLSDENGFLFVRPNSGRKVFTGTTIGLGEHQYICKAMDSTTSVTDTTLILVSKAKPILAEFRFFVVQNQIVTGSFYNWSASDTTARRVPLINPETYRSQALGLAEEVAKFDWQLDTCYTVDIAVTADDGCKIVELNSFACAGFYDSDLSLIVQAVSKSALEEWVIG